MKMKDLITPDYSTLQIMATPRYKSVRAKEITVEENGESVRKVSLDPRNFTRTDEFYEIGEGNNVNEGAHMIEKDGKFYLTYSPTGTGNILYSICQAVSDSPLGPFKKLPECNPVIGLNDTNDYMSCTGHHSFVYIEDEIFALYHCFWQELSASGGRCLAVDRAKFMYNETLGHDILYGMGPTQAVQPANKAHTGLVFNEVHLLFESGLQGNYDGVIVVYRPLEDRINSVISRSGLPREEVLKRIKNQFNYENFDKTKHTVISNDGVLENLKRRVKEVLIEIEKNL
jgi:hypothetical protein